VDAVSVFIQQSCRFFDFNVKFEKLGMVEAIESGIGFGNESDLEETEVVIYPNPTDGSFMKGIILKAFYRLSYFIILH
jgi:hypothetical protein